MLYFEYVITDSTENVTFNWCTPKSIFYSDSANIAENTQGVYLIALANRIKRSIIASPLSVFLAVSRACPIRNGQNTVPSGK